ncbi:MAG: Glycerate dehydrogenase [Candidatus Heimdallarchaeota archaeon LC_2]|nr:MAG: Glycerate dehydrogenase [Candidatus Heimdallarchaeota archaeon LC_2]
MKNNVAYGISWIPVSLIQSFMKSEWNFLDYTRRQLTYEEVNLKKPKVIISFRAPPNQLLDTGNVKWVISPGAGIDNISLDEIRKNKITLINNHANSSTVAEQAWALLLNAAKKINKYDTIVRSQGLWPDRSSQIKDVNTELKNKTIGILGYGPIAQKIEKYANAFAMEHIIFRRNPTQTQFHFTKLLDEAENLDVLILACPLTPETKEIISEDIIENLPAHCILVNIARGELIDEEAVFDALREGKIHSYASDVWKNSPVIKNEKGTKPIELIEVPNLIISPHRAWISNESHIKVAEQIAFELDSIAKGIKSSNIVDLSLEY